MPNIPSMPSIPGGGTRAQRAAQLKAQAEAKAAEAAKAGGAPAGGAAFRPVKARETLEDIAAEYDMSPEEIWEHPLNAQVYERRQDPSELEEGDALYIPGQSQPKLEPVGQGDYVARDGDCMASIAKDTGHFWENLWNDSANSELREVRQDPNVLLPGDRVTVPAVRPKQEPGETEMRHRFVRKGEPASLKLCVCVEDEPLSHEPYVLVVDGDEENALRGTTDTDGNIAVPIPGNARVGMLRVGPENDPLVYELQLGHLSPKQDVKGAQGRLRNLGYRASESGELDYETREALREFQHAAQLPVTGELDTATEERLRDTHGA